MKNNFTDIDSYIAQFSKEIQQRLKQLRNTIRKAAPKAEESIKYGMPAYVYQKRPLVYFAGYENHIGFYGLPSAHEAFKKELSVFKVGKGSVQFPHDEKLPLDLVSRMVEFRTKENDEKALLKKSAAKKTVKKASR